jgi:hypothetical protein
MADIFELGEQASEALRAYAAHPDTPPRLGGTLEDLADILDRRWLEAEANAAVQAAIYFQHVDEKAMRKEWHRSATYRAARDSYRVVPIAAQAACRLADNGVDLERATKMTDAELLALGRIGPVTIGKLRTFIAQLTASSQAWQITAG